MIKVKKVSEKYIYQERYNLKVFVSKLENVSNNKHLVYKEAFSGLSFKLSELFYKALRKEIHRACKTHDILFNEFRFTIDLCSLRNDAVIKRYVYDITDEELEKDFR